MKVYFISGLAADRRVFRGIVLPEGFEVVYLDWIDPNVHEDLPGYAMRLASGIDTSEPFVLVGLSMGGMIAAEISKRYEPLCTILLSSAWSYRQFPRRFRFAYFFRVHQWMPPALFKSSSILKRLFSTESSQDKQLLKQLIRDSDPGFIKWAVGAILRWRNEEQPRSLWHIHGTNDEILPMRKMAPTHTVTKGTHLMVLTRAAEINKILEELLEAYKLH